MLVGAHLAGAKRFVEGYRLHRPKQCGKVVAHKYAHPPQGVGKGVGYSGLDQADKPLPHQQAVVFGRFAWLWLCPHLEKGAWSLRKDHLGLCLQVREDALSLRADRLSLGASKDRFGVHRDVGRGRRALCPHLYQVRQAVGYADAAQRYRLQETPVGAVGGVASDVAFVERKRTRKRGYINFC